MQKTPSKNVDRTHLSDSEIIDSMCKDISGWIQSSIWPYSCYSVAKNYNTFPGFDDVSPEEIRWKAYEAKNNNTMPQYESMLAEMSTRYDALKKKLINVTPMERPQLENILKSIKITGEAGSMNTAFNQSPFGQTAPTSIFGNNTATPAAGIFGGNVSNNNNAQPIFGGATSTTGGTSIFGNSNYNNNSPTFIFGGGAATQPNKSIFGDNSNNNSSSIFGKTNEPTSIFGGSSVNVAAQPQSIFGNNAANQAAPSIFGNSAINTAVAVAPTPSIFGNSSATPSIFGANTTVAAPSIFGQTAAAATPIFGQATPIFGATTPAVGGQPVQSIFGAAPVQQPIQQPASIFGGGGGAAAAQPIFGQMAAAAPCEQMDTVARLTPVRSIFGGGASVANNTATAMGTGIFGGGGGAVTSNTAAADTGIFGGGVNTVVAAPSSGGGIFGLGGGTAAVKVATPAPYVPQKSIFASLESNREPALAQPALQLEQQQRERDLITGGQTVLFGKVERPQYTYSGMYRLAAEVSAEEMAAFRADEFDLDLVPLLPPPKELCV